MKGCVTRHPLASFFFLAYAVSWSIAVPLALQAQGVLPEHLPWSLHYLTAFGPATAAFVIARLLRKRAEMAERAPSRALARSILWWTIGFGSPLLLFLVAQAAARIVGQTARAWTSLGHVNFLPDLGVMAWGLWFLTSGLGEEPGWRGFALPRLQRTHSAMTSSLLLAIGWAGWHLPAFFYVPSYTAIGLRILPGFFLGVLAGAIVLTWLYNSQRLKELITNDPAFSAVKIDYHREFWDAMSLAQFDPDEGFAEISRRRSYARPSLPTKAISTVHRAKGLECRNVLILPCDAQHFAESPSARCRLYVAMSRPTHSLTFVVSQKTPSPLFKL